MTGNTTKTYHVGLDVGSTTAKLAVLDSDGNLVFHRYVRHHADIGGSVSALLRELSAEMPDCMFRMMVTGSAAMGLAERAGLPFVQELVASSAFVTSVLPEVRTLIDMGGEDTKLVFFDERRLPDIRMNGSCAGGTGAFIDQMATLMDVTPQAFDELAAAHRTLCPIASRCGVFAKTDVQNLLSHRASPEDVAYSVYYATALQSMNTLARGRDVVPKVLFTGGPFSFLPTLSQAFLSVLGLSEADCVRTAHPELVPAQGAALCAAESGLSLPSVALAGGLSLEGGRRAEGRRLHPLFDSPEALRQWKEERKDLPFDKVSLKEYGGEEAFLGIDSGSTTTKIVLTGIHDELLFRFYAPNNGKVVESVRDGLLMLQQQLRESPHPPVIAAEAVTGYGEDLIRTAFGLSDGLAETMAHYTAARKFCPEVSFILDIGGQDMKAFFITDGRIRRIELNESCSSGCGSFIETFSRSLGHDVETFAGMACRAEAPCDLGSRCTVFMNSRVKQALRECATVEDIAAGLSYAVVNNALHKVLGIKDMDELGGHIMVQGGTFRNASVRRAFERLTGRTTGMTEFPELMGAYGAALHARSMRGRAGACHAFSWEHVAEAAGYTIRARQCAGCQNRCPVNELQFPNGRSFFSGNKCENIFHNQGTASVRGENLSAYKLQQLFLPACPEPPAAPGTLTIGIPRALHFYEKHLFWQALLATAGIRTVLSPSSTTEVFRKGVGSIMSDNICFPAKLLHGHVRALLDMHPDRILYPMAFYETREHEGAENTFNCPIVSSYADVLRSAVLSGPDAVPLESPCVNFADPVLLKKACTAWLQSLGVPQKKAAAAFAAALKAQAAFKLRLKVKADALIRRALENGETLVVLAGRPYHTDPLVNSKVPEMLSQLGAHVITEDMVPLPPHPLKGLQVIPQWSYTNRIYAAAAWVASAPPHVQMVQVNSFGCGPDAIALDEVRAILHAGGKYLTMVRVDEINATGSLRLRLRTMLAFMQSGGDKPVLRPRPENALFLPADKTRRTIIAPDFGPFYSALLGPVFSLSGYRYEPLPEPDRHAVQTGLRYANNEICYPATTVIGSLIDALRSGRYDRNTVAVGITQTCGQCRASSYLSLLKKALAMAGFSDVPAITIGTEGGTINPQPGMKIRYLPFIRSIMAGMLSADMLMKMTYATAARELRPGAAKQLAQQYIGRVKERFEANRPDDIYALMEEAVRAFLAVPVHDRPLRKVGLVGEIYVKYNPFANGHIVDWLHRHDAEVVVPPLTDFFVQSFINRKVNKRAFLARGSVAGDMLSGALWRMADRAIARANAILAGFPAAEPFDDIRTLARLAEPLLHVENQAGEGWLIPAEVAQFAEHGVLRVVSVQPFGCIANQIVSKGIEKRIRAAYPSMNLLFLDYDSNVSEVNVQNRLHFILQ